MKVRLIGVDTHGNRKYKGYFTTKDGKKVIFFPSSEAEPLSDQQFVDQFGNEYPVFFKNRMAMVSMHEPNRYLKYLEQRYHGLVWVEKSTGKRRRCPVCDSNKVVRIIYGLPAPLPEGADPNDWRNKQILGGCCVFPGQAKWGCTDCGYRF